MTTEVPVRALLLDIEGTTTPIDFVYNTLFPFARDRVADFVIEHENDLDVRTDLDLLVSEHNEEVSNGFRPPTLDGKSRSLIDYFLWLMDEDRKSTALKSLQGKIWQEGYHSGALQGIVYDDVPRAFARWQGQKRSIAIYSSGSVLAQRLIFAHTNAGDLTHFISSYFDTTSGPKKESESYTKIAGALGLPPAEILFCSDTQLELDAANKAEMQTALCIRQGGLPAASAHRVVSSFDELL